MKKLLTRRSFHSQSLAILLLALVAAGCSNEMNFGPTAPQEPQFPRTGDAIWTLHIAGSLAATNSSLLRATVLFDGQELEGARSQCQEARGCAQLELGGVVSTSAGHHTITFQVLRQAEEVDSYLATGIVEVSRLDVQGLDPLIIQLQPTRATLQAGEGVTFELDLWE